MLRLGAWGLLVLLAASVAGCAPATPPQTTVTVKGDKFSKDITLEGIPLHAKNGIDLFWMLRSFVNPQTHTTVHQIYVEWIYTGGSPGKYFAADDTARDLPVENIRRESCAFNNCPRTDILGIAFDEASLRKRVATGFQVKLETQDGYSTILDITPQMINAQLQAEDRILDAPSGMSAQAAAASANARTPEGKPMLGIAPMDLLFGVGVMVSRVDPGTPAEAAGFQTGDMVKTYNGQTINKADQLRALIEQTQPGTLVPIDVTRKGQAMTLSVQM